MEQSRASTSYELPKHAHEFFYACSCPNDRSFSSIESCKEKVCSPGRCRNGAGRGATGRTCRASRARRQPPCRPPKGATSCTAHPAIVMIHISSGCHLSVQNQLIKHCRFFYGIRVKFQTHISYNIKLASLRF